MAHCVNNMESTFCHLLAGNVSRVCYENTTWAEPDVSGCQSRQFQELKESVRYCSYAVEIYVLD